jgi:signal transduction histidine kinase
MNLNKDSGDLNRAIQSVIKYISPIKRFYSITFTTEFSPLPMCNYDSEQIQHLLVHLFTNSAEARSDATILVKTYVENHNIVVRVSDNGPGFPPDKIDKIFELANSQKNNYGLFLCKSIIDQHNGDIKVIPVETGAAIQFTLPVV